MHVIVAAEGQKGESSQVELAGEGGWAEWASLAVRVQLEGESSAQDGSRRGRAVKGCVYSN